MGYKQDFDYKGFWNRVDELLLSNHMSMYELHEKCNLRGTYLFVMRNRHSIPSIPVINRMCDVLDTNIEYLVNGDKNLIKGDNLYESIVISKMRSDPAFRKAVIMLSENKAMVRLIAEDN